MSRLSKITFLMNIQILYLFVIYFPTIIFVGARVGFIKNTWAAIIVFLYFAFIFGLLSSIPVEFFSERALRKYRNSGEAAVIPIELNASNNFKKLIINDFSTFYYKKITTINSISVHKISTFNYHYCKELLGNFYDKIIFFFPSLRRRYSRHRFSRWFTNINIFLYYGDAPINDLEKLVKNFNKDANYSEFYMVCAYSAKQNLLVIKKFSLNNKHYDFALYGYRRCVKALCKFYGLKFKELAKFL